MLRCGVSKEKLAEKIGITLPAMHNLIGGNFVSSARARFKVENFFKIPIWSSVEDFNYQQEAIRILGVDPFTLTCRELRACARKHKIPLAYVSFHRKSVLPLVLDYVNRQSKPNTHEEDRRAAA